MGWIEGSLSVRFRSIIHKIFLPGEEAVVSEIKSFDSSRLYGIGKRDFARIIAPVEEVLVLSIHPGGSAAWRVVTFPMMTFDG
jgi:hypothetical protein